MNFINPPTEAPQGVYHKTYYSELLKQEVGYNIYLPPDYQESGKTYPVAYHFHGWQGDESSDIWALEEVYRNREAITVFVNANTTANDYFPHVLLLESIIMNELIPHIDGSYKTSTTREHKSISGFSMGGNIAFYYAIKYSELFGSVTAYAGTYHHLYHKEYRTVGVAPEKVMELYEDMLREEWYLEENNILCLIRQSADRIRGNLHIELHIGKADILFCDNEILHLYLNSLDIPHEYKVFEDVEHELGKII